MGLIRRERTVSKILLSISLFFLPALVAGVFTWAHYLPADPVEFNLGWISSYVGFTNTAGDMMAVAGMCLLDEDFDILIKAHPELDEPFVESLFPGEEEDVLKLGI